MDLLDLFVEVAPPPRKSALDDLLGVAPPPEAAPLSDRMGISPFAPPEGERLVYEGFQGVKDSKELQRILALPRRSQARGPDAEAVAVAQTALYRRPGSTAALRPIQAVALEEAPKAGGLLGLIGVGWGKTLLSLLLPVALRSRRAVILLPPQLRDQLIGKDYPMWAREFFIPNLSNTGVSVFYKDAPPLELHVVSYTDLSNAKRGDVLERIKPDLIVADEAHNLKRPSSARTKRFLRWYREHPETRLCALSGTLTTRSIRDFGHLSALALGSGSPLPRDYKTTEEWAPTLDGEALSPPGELSRFCQPGETARQGFARRLGETMGVITTTEASVGASLEISAWEPPEVPPEAKEAIHKMRSSWERPDKEVFEDALRAAEAIRQLATGFYYRWIWPRGEPKDLQEEWKDARAAYHKEVRDRLKVYSRPKQDSPWLLELAAIRFYKRVAEAEAAGLPRPKPRQDGEGGPEWESYCYPEWDAIRHKCKPETEAVWVSDFFVKAAVEWGKTPGIIWYEHGALGEAIAKAGGFRHFPGGKKPDAEIRELSDRILAGAKAETIVASIDAHHFGKNLQGWSRNLFTTCPSSGGVVEQLIGRTHRAGQPADVVTVEIPTHVHEMVRAFESAYRDAGYATDMTNQVQRLKAARILFDFDR